jgi:hypothetical protein
VGGVRFGGVPDSAQLVRGRGHWGLTGWAGGGSRPSSAAAADMFVACVLGGGCSVQT